LVLVEALGAGGGGYVPPPPLRYLVATKSRTVTQRKLRGL
jgi:hypothetical protein